MTSLAALSRPLPTLPRTTAQHAAHLSPALFTLRVIAADCSTVRAARARGVNETAINLYLLVLIMCIQTYEVVAIQNARNVAFPPPVRSYRVIVWSGGDSSGFRKWNDGWLTGHGHDFGIHGDSLPSMVRAAFCGIQRSVLCPYLTCTL